MQAVPKGNRGALAEGGPYPCILSTIVDGGKVAAKLDMTTNQIYQAKSRVTARLRRELTTAVGKVL